MTKTQAVKHAPAGVPAHTEDMRRQCPVLTGEALAEFKAAAKAANVFSRACYDFLSERSPEEQVAWLRTSVSSGRMLFKPWNMEILYTISVLGRARFTQMRDLLGLSSRTLSDKLKALRAEGFIDREVFDEQPVRIEYFPTLAGRRTAALASPLVAHLNVAHR
jgi:DNA-binding HxlR family transcriptional regulator